VLYTLAELLPQFENDDLESQLQTFDTFLGILAPSARPAIRDLLQNAAEQSPHPASKLRLENAAKSVGSGGPAAESFDHDASMRKYRGTQSIFRRNCGRTHHSSLNPAQCKSSYATLSFLRSCLSMINIPNGIIDVSRATPKKIKDHR
jgi:hypothetical protein